MLSQILSAVRQDEKPKLSEETYHNGQWHYSQIKDHQEFQAQEPVQQTHP